MKKESLLAYGLLFLIIITAFIPIYGSQLSQNKVSTDDEIISEKKGLYNPNINLTSHEPIIIDNNEDFNQTASEEGWNGTGTEDDPYLIENYEINARMSSAGIYIGNTTAYFKIQNCSLHDAVNIQEQVGNGIKFFNVSHGNIQNNLIELNYKRGVNINNSTEIILKQNIIANNHHIGLSITNSENITSYSNSYTNNTNKGISLDKTNNVELFNCDIKKNRNDGIYIKDTQNTNIQNNIIKNNSIDGINIVNSNNTNIKENNITYNKDSGILTKNSNSAIIENNIINFNEIGIKKLGSLEDKIIDNQMYHNERGIILEKSKNIEIKNNELKNNSLELMYGPINTWNTHTIDDTNTIDGKPLLYIKNEDDIELENDYSQIILANCSDVKIANKDISGMYGIDIGYSENIHIQNNTIKNLKKTVRFISTSNADIFNNLFLKNERAMILFDSNDNTIFNNRIESSYRDGIFIERSYNNIIANNTIKDNDIDGVEISNSLANLVKNNLFISNDRYGIKLNGQSKINRIYQNTFLWNNGADLTYNTKHIQAYGNGKNFWNSSNVGNYWRDWTHPDSNNDAVVDSPYDIEGDADAKDYYPITKSPIPLLPTISNFQLKIKSGTAKLLWDSPNENGYLDIDEYWIYREDNSGSTYFIGNVSADSNTFNDTSLDKKGTYTYYIRSVNVTKNEAEGSLPSEKLSLNYEPKESQGFPIYIITILVGIVGIVVVYLALNRKIKESKKEETKSEKSKKENEE